MESLFNLTGTAPAVVKPSAMSVFDNVGWLNVIVIVIVLVMLWHHSGRRDRFDGGYKGYLGASSGFNSVWHSRFQAERYADTPYPYDPSCGDVEDAWQYALNVALVNNPNLQSDPHYPAWSALYQNYLQLLHANSMAPSSSAQQAASQAWDALQAYQSANNFDPTQSLTPATQNQLKTQDIAVQTYMSDSSNTAALAPAESFGNPQGILNARKSKFINPASLKSNTRFAAKPPGMISTYRAAPRNIVSTFGNPQGVINKSVIARHDGFDAGTLIPPALTANYTQSTDGAQTVMAFGQGQVNGDDRLYAAMNGHNIDNGLTAQ